MDESCSTADAREASALPVLSGRELDEKLRVDVGLRLGGGASGRVYEATYEGQHVALKVLHPHAARKETEVSSFLREAHMLAELSHSNIIRVLAICHIPPAFCGLPTRRTTYGVILELAQAGTLSKAISSSQPWQQPPASPKREHGTLAVNACSSGNTSRAPAAAAANSTSNVPAAAAAAAPANRSSPGARSSAGLRPSSDLRVCADAGRTSSPRMSPQDGKGSHAQQTASAYSNATAISWCLDIARALDHLHTQQPPIVHRDVKALCANNFNDNAIWSRSAAILHGVLAACICRPDNVLLVYDNRHPLMEPPGGALLAHTLAKLADFGLHVVLDDRDPGPTASSISELLRNEFLNTGGGSKVSMHSGLSMTASASVNPAAGPCIADSEHDAESLLAPVLALASPVRLAAPGRPASPVQPASPAQPTSPTRSRASPQNSAAQSLARRMSSFLIAHQSISGSAPASKRPSSFLSAHSSDLLSAASMLNDDQPRPGRAHRHLSRQASHLGAEEHLSTRASTAPTAYSTASVASSMLATAIPAANHAPQPALRVRPPPGLLSSSLRLKFAASVSAPGASGEHSVQDAPFEFDSNIVLPSSPEASHRATTACQDAQSLQAQSLLSASLAQSLHTVGMSGASSMLHEDLRAALLRRQSSHMHPREMMAGLEGRLSPKQSRHAPMWARSASQGGDDAALLPLSTSPANALTGRPSSCMSPTRMASAATSRLSHTGHQPDGASSGRCTAKPSRAPSSINLRDPPSRSSTRSTCEGDLEPSTTHQQPGNTHVRNSPVGNSPAGNSTAGNSTVGARRQLYVQQGQQTPRASEESPEQPKLPSQDTPLRPSQDTPLRPSQDTPLRPSQDVPLRPSQDIPLLLVAVPQLKDDHEDDEDEQQELLQLQPQAQPQQQRYILQHEGHVEAYQPRQRRTSRLRISDPKGSTPVSKTATGLSDSSKEVAQPEDVMLGLPHSSVSDAGYVVSAGQIPPSARFSNKRGTTQDQPVSRLRPASGRASLDSLASRLPLSSTVRATVAVWGASKSHEPAGIRRRSEDRVTAAQLRGTGSAPQRRSAEAGASSNAMKASIAASLLTGHSFAAATRAAAATAAAPHTEAQLGATPTHAAHRLRSSPCSFNHSRSPLRQTSKNGAAEMLNTSMTRTQQLRMPYDAAGVSADGLKLSHERLISSTSLTNKTSSASRKSSEHNSASEGGSSGPLPISDLMGGAAALQVGSMHSSMSHLSRAVAHLRSRDGHLESSPFFQRSLGQSPQHSRLMDANSASGATVQVSEPSGSTATGPSRTVSAKPSMPGAARGSLPAMGPSSFAARAAQQLLLRGGSSSMHAGLSLPQLSNVSSSSPGHSVIYGARSRRSSERFSDWAASEGGYTGDTVYPITSHAGTPVYMAPEVANQELYNEKADVFSFGIVMYEVLGRTLLLSGRTREEVNYMSERVQSGYRPRILACIPDGDAWHLIQWCWMQEPSKRPTMSQVVCCLENIKAQLTPKQASSAHSSVAGVGLMPQAPPASSSAGCPTPRKSADIPANAPPASRFARMVAASSILQPRLSKKDAVVQVAPAGQDPTTLHAAAAAAAAGGILPSAAAQAAGVQQLQLAKSQELDDTTPAGSRQPACCGGCTIS